MSKKTKQRKHKGYKNKKIPVLQPRYFSMSLSKFWALVVYVSVVLTIIVSLLSLSPSITVSSSQSLDVHDPLATPFLIRNESLLPIHSIKISCGINKIMYGDHVEISNSLIFYEMPPIPILNRNEQKTFLCDVPLKFQSPITSGDISIKVLYRPDYLFWHKRQSLRFVIRKDESGIMHWYPEPLSEIGSN
jgi:hypothetical protein